MNESNSILKLTLDVLAVILLFGICGDEISQGAVGSDYPKLFVESQAGIKQLTMMESIPAEIRKRKVNIHRQLLSDLFETGGGVLKLNLFGDTAFDCLFTNSVKRSSDSYTWFGEVLGESLGNVAISVKGKAVVGNISVPDRGLFRIRYLSEDDHEIIELKESYFGEEDDTVSIEFPGEELSIETQAEMDEGNEFDVMVVYTTAVRDFEGGTEAVEALINLAVDETNQAYENSLINPRLRLVYQDLVDYNEVDSWTDLSRLRGTSDGYMDIVHPLRDVYGADLVCLIRRGGTSLGYLMTFLSTNFSSSAFSVVSNTLATGFYHFGHELGHNMGCHHAVGDSGTLRGDGLYNYSHGWRWVGDSTTEFRSIMAYSPGTIAQHFSNPNVLYDGVATGRVNLEDNARTINNAAYTVSNFRQSVSSFQPPTANNVLVDLAGVEDSITVNLSASDDGHPIPPNALKYIIKSLPQKGLLEEPNGSPINTVPYMLSDYGDTVVYIPLGDYDCPDRFLYYADDSGFEPEGGKSNIATVTTNVERVIYSTDMTSNPYWSMTGKWAWGAPTGGGTHNHDPTSGYTGTKVVGYNLKGDYANNITSPYYATINMIDCNDYSNVKLSFYRWLGVEQNYWDHANIKVSNNGIDWTVIWENPTDAIADTDWQYMEYDISSVADDQNKVYVRWSMGPTDVSVRYPGWNIDDVKLTGFKTVSVIDGDFDLDCYVDFLDFAVLGSAWNSSEGEENWNLLCDMALVRDGVIDVNDLGKFISQWLIGAD
jgi:hypothetical protein